MFELKKIGFIKRASALLLDAILLAVLATGFIWLISLMCNFDHHWKLADQYQQQYNDFDVTYIRQIAKYYDKDFIVEEDEEGNLISIKKMDGTAATNNEILTIFVGDESKPAVLQEAYAAYDALPTVATYNMQWRLATSLLFMMISLGILLSYLVLEFILPIILKNGQTVGKKVFGIALVRPDCVKIKNLALFARTFLGKFAIETMFPVLLAFLFFFGRLGWVALALLGALLVLNVVLFFVRKNRTPIHDILANTVAVDMKLQMIYASEEELAAQKAKHKEFLPSAKD